MLDLCAGEVAIYVYLMYREDRETYKCHPSYTTIGDALQMSKNTVAKYVRMLEKKHLIKTRYTTFDHNGKCVNGNLEYTILPICEAIKIFDEKQERQLQFEFQKAQVLEKLEKFDKRHKKSKKSGKADAISGKTEIEAG